MTMSIHLLPEAPQRGQRFFFDTNVWRLLTDPNPSTSASPRARPYAKLYGEILRVGAQIFVSAIILSELVNLMARKDFERKKPSLQPKLGGRLDFKKDFRDTPEFQPTRQLINFVVTGQVLKNSVELPIPVLPLADVHADFRDSDVDFNDAIIGRQCETERLVLVTDDSDFAQTTRTLEIWTANQRLRII